MNRALAKLTVGLALLGIYGCAELPVRGQVIEKPGLAAAVDSVWVGTYSRTDRPPVVFLVEGAGLTCTDEQSGVPGFECPTVGCRGGCTSNPASVSVAFRGVPWHQSSLAHELRHAMKMRIALLMLNYSPDRAMLQMLADKDHRGPDWEPGGEVDKANANLLKLGL